MRYNGKSNLKKSMKRGWLMNWYDKLNQYFPIEEMKSQAHMRALLKDKPDLYKKDEGPKHIVTYAEFDDFIFVDYLLVSKEARGEGLGSKIIKRLQDKGKPLILEVEPLSYEDTDTRKRHRFYERHGFKKAEAIGYRRRSLATGEMNALEILYWSPTDESEHEIYEKMKKVYEDIHAYKDQHFYGEPFAPSEEVFTVDEQAEEQP